VLYPRGGPDAPDEQDLATLAARYAHADEDDRCGVLDLHLGPLCF